MTSTTVRWLVLITAFMTACIPGALRPGVSAIPTYQGDPPSTPPATVISPEIPTSPGCYYVWATRDLPALSEKFQRELAHLSGSIRASAYAFGEECRGDDGTVTFLPMETDFRVRIPVTTLAVDAALGTWISDVMSVVEAIPASEVPGTRPGRVEYEFYVDESSGLRLVVDISRYRSEAVGLDSVSVLRLFKAGP